MSAESQWEDLSDVVETAAPDALEEFLGELAPADRTLAVSRLSDEARERLLTLLPPGDAAEIVEGLPDAQVKDALESMPSADAARILEELSSHHAADIVTELEEERAEAILKDISPEDRVSIQALAEYDDDSAGGLMQREFLAFDRDTLVGDVIASLQAGAERYAHYDVQYVYVTDSAGRLEGVLYLRTLLLTPPWQPIESVSLKEPRSARVDASTDELRALFDTIGFHAVPVLDVQRHLVGVVRRSAVEERLAERTESDFRLSQGIVGGEELRTMPTAVRARRRLSWLSVNVVLNVIAASVIAANEDVLSQVIALAVFLPILSDMSGCSGNQAVAVTMRELSLGVLRPNEVLRTALAEVRVGLINGALLGLLVGAAAWAYSGTPWLGIVVGAALLINTIVAVLIGGCVPLVLKRFGVDPALASGPLLTTVTDMCGFFLVLTFAGAVLPKLVG